MGRHDRRNSMKMRRRKAQAKKKAREAKVRAAKKAISGQLRRPARAPKSTGGRSTLGNALLLERHDWETSGSEHQVQIPKAAFAQFFRTPGSIQVRVSATPTGPKHARSLLLSYYDKSDTCRFNWMTEFGSFGHAVIVFEETGDPACPYEVWWFDGQDANAILARPYKWQQAKDSQYGPGRRWVIIQAPAPRAA